MRTVVAFDPGLNLGSAEMKDGKLIKIEVYKNDSKRPLWERMEELTDYIATRIYHMRITHVVVEQVNRTRGAKQDNEKNEHTWALYWVYGEVIRLAHKFNKELVPINPISMKHAVMQGEERDIDPKTDKPSKCPSKSEIARVVKGVLPEEFQKIRNDATDAGGLAIADWKIHNGIYVPGAKKKKKVTKK